MSDIFLSYKSEDRARAKILAEALVQQGYSVWWDRIILPGKTFDEVIEEALDAAKCVIVLWSRGSVLSDWVKNEARDGVRRRVLVPVLIDDVKIPFEFRHIQAAQLVDWQGTLPNPEFDLLLNSVAEIVGRSPKPEVKKPPINELNIFAQQLYDEGKYTEAIDKWKEVLKLDSENKVAKDGIKKQIIELNADAERLFKNKLYKEAIAKWQKVLELDRENREAVDGREKYNKILEYTLILNNYAYQLYYKGKYHEAVDMWIEVLNLYPENKTAKDGIEAIKDGIEKTIEEINKKLMELSADVQRSLENRLYWELSKNLKAIEGIEEAVKSEAVQKMIEDAKKQEPQLAELYAQADELYAQAEKADKAQDWEQVISAYQKIRTIVPAHIEYKDVATLLAKSLYEEAKTRHENASFQFRSS